MKTRILFVDDEPLVLDGLQRLLHPMRREWDMDFVSDGGEACARLSRARYDVLLTDIAMPRTDGAQLLEFARQRSPHTIRLVLSGHLDQRVSMKCVGVAHQWLTKPCDAAVIRATISRVTNPGFGARNARVMTLVSGLGRLPSVPETYSQILRLLADPTTSMEDVGAVIARDPALTAKVLHAVNSAFFGLAHRVSEPAEAASFLGMDTLKALVLATDVFAQFLTRMPLGFPAARVPARSRRVAAAARVIAQAEEADRAVTDDAFCAGLLGDIGLLALASSRPAQFLRLPGGGRAPIEAEQELFGATHAEVGGYLLGLWGLPPSVTEAVSFHHAPGASREEKFCALAAAHAADVLLDELSGETPVAPLDIAFHKRLGHESRIPVWRAAVRELLANGFD
jgi:HD-like signal output (HDOD) protein/CheY-like chemotaxis protein